MVWIWHGIKDPTTLILEEVKAMKYNQKGVTAGKKLRQSFRYNIVNNYSTIANWKNYNDFERV